MHIFSKILVPKRENLIKQTLKSLYLKVRGILIVVLSMTTWHIKRASKFSKETYHKHKDVQGLWNTAAKVLMLICL